MTRFLCYFSNRSVSDRGCLDLLLNFHHLRMYETAAWSEKLQKASENRAIHS